MPINVLLPVIAKLPVLVFNAYDAVSAYDALLTFIDDVCVAFMNPNPLI